VRVRIPLGETSPGISYGAAGEPRHQVINSASEIRLWISGRWGDDEGSQDEAARGRVWWRRYSRYLANAEWQRIRARVLADTAISRQIVTAAGEEVAELDSCDRGSRGAKRFIPRRSRM